MRIEETIEIAQSPERVYEFMANVNNLPRCSSAVHEVKGAPEAAVSQGDRYTTIAKILGRTIETDHQVNEADPPNRLVIAGTTGRTRVQVTINFEPSDSGTRVTQIGEGEPGGALRFVGPVFERTMRRQIRSDLDTLKKVLEQEG